MRRGQELEDAKLRLGQLQAMPVGERLQGIRVDEEAFSRIDARPRGLGGGAAEDGLHARRKLLGGERLYDVVIRAELEAEDPVRFFRAGGKDDDRNGGEVPVGADAAADREPVRVRKHEVQDDEVRLFGRAGTQGTHARRRYSRTRKRSFFSAAATRARMSSSSSTIATSSFTPGM